MKVHPGVSRADPRPLKNFKAVGRGCHPPDAPGIQRNMHRRV
jgi:hypothetical protein